MTGPRSRNLFRMSSTRIEDNPNSAPWLLTRERQTRHASASHSGGVPCGTNIHHAPHPRFNL